MKGCCTNCGGTGVDASAPETNGKCWDCYGTGHVHLVEPDDPYIPKPTWRCRIFGHKFYRWEIVDDFWNRSKIRQSHCVRCGIECMS